MSIARLDAMAAMCSMNLSVSQQQRPNYGPPSFVKPSPTIKKQVDGGIRTAHNAMMAKLAPRCNFVMFIHTHLKGVKVVTIHIRTEIAPLPGLVAMTADNFVLVLELM